MGGLHISQSRDRNILYRTQISRHALPWSNPEIFTRVVCLDTTTVGTWPEGYERCSVFGSVETIRLNDYPCDTERLAESFAAFPNLKTIEIHSGGSDFGDKLDRLLVERLPNVDVRRITMR